jgi:trehalose-6-phosphate hydrolase
MPRLVDRLARKSERTALAALILTAKGVPFIYYVWEEIGMENMNPILTEMDIQARTNNSGNKRQV